MHLSLPALTLKRKIVLGVIGVLLLVGVGYGENRDYNIGNSYVSVTGNLKAPQRAEIYGRLLENRHRIGSIDDVKKVLDGVSWISHVNVMRRWPDQITVAVTPEQPIAWWNGDAFLDDNGHVFRSRYVDEPGLARLYGPGGSEDEVMEQYQQLSRALGSAGRSISTLRLDARGAWQFTTADGIRVMLGKDDIMDRFQRFLQVLGSKQLALRVNDIKQIDTRYSNGVAVSWKEVPTGLRVAKTENY